MSSATAFAEATAAHRRGDLVSAATRYRGVLMREPNHAEALFWLGTILTQQGNVREGLPLLEKAVATKPRLPGAYHHLGNVYRKLGRTADAADALRHATALEPHNAKVRNNLGGTLIQLESYAEAENHLRRALAIDPGHRAAMVNLGALTEITGRYDETLAWYDRALALQANDPETRYQRAGALLIRGQLAEGFDAYRVRFERPDGPALHGKFPFPIWGGEPLSGKHVLVWLEQGLGDEILAATMLPDIISLAAQVTLICAPRLLTLFQRAFPTVRVVTPEHLSLPDDIDVQATFSELGRWLRPSLPVFPVARAYLSANTNWAESLRAKYRSRAGDRALVGISWKSNSPGAEREKSIPLAAWSEILQTPHAAFVSVQYGETSAVISEAERATGIGIIADADIDPMRDLEGAAAQIAAMDLVISVSNTTVHLAGALGQRVWAMIPSDRGRLWYWFLDRADSPWYSRLRLFRKPVAGAWTDVVGDVAAALREFRAK